MDTIEQFLETAAQLADDADSTMDLGVEQPELDALASGTHVNPHNILGLHDCCGQKVIRLWRPGAKTVFLEVNGATVQATVRGAEGLFEYLAPNNLTVNGFRVYHQDGLLAADPYSVSPCIGEVDQYLFGQGTHYGLYHILGAHLSSHDGVSGVHFAVWAPSAQRVSLVGDFNYWNGLVNPMRNLGSSGIWELFVPGLQEGCRYKFELKTQSGLVTTKSDPYAFSSELRPNTASVVTDVHCFAWTDDVWLRERQRRSAASGPMAIYEVHLASWRRPFGRALPYRKLAHELADYCKEMGFTHVELLPITEHPLDESWGYQCTGYYAPTSRHGSAQDFQYFVNHLHSENIGVILDWVPGHFPVDSFALADFDGTSLYEHADPRQGMHPHWGTKIFNFGRKEVSNFLIANALYWLELMHIDGLRVDAVASMLYLDYGRDSGQWVANQDGGKENLDAIEFLKHLNSVVHKRCPGALTIAEESTSFCGVSHPVDGGGLGFDMKWNMGWMNDTLRYFSTDPLYRKHYHSDLTFGLLYAYSERFTLVLSHDEVVHGKKSLLSKMPGDDWQRFANLRLLYSYMVCQPGKCLLFMGAEMGQHDEWNSQQELPWHLLQYERHNGIQAAVRDLNNFYTAHPALWERDFDPSGFEWIDFCDTDNSVISYLRKSRDEALLCVHNFTPAFHSDYVINLANVSQIQEVFNTDNLKYWGSDKTNDHVDIIDHGSRVRIAVAPLATMIFSVTFHC